MEKGEALFGKLLDKNPGWVWIGWSNQYWMDDENIDYEKSGQTEKLKHIKQVIKVCREAIKTGKTPECYI